ncbi:hypothetical protein E2C01_039436 [Portunus trituberculatus]|uniref:Uncharacterized protein n=1 Tax=Portunus trituberculatus TaxID=210409 RepID=A0A5B7FDM8_PORTR|nr:hypothetical protein [Portunus trituberculatus]
MKDEICHVVNTRQLTSRKEILVLLRAVLGVTSSHDDPKTERSGSSERQERGERRPGGRGREAGIRQTSKQLFLKLLLCHAFH